MTKKKFKETKFAKILGKVGKAAGGGILNVASGGVLGTMLDFDNDGKVTMKDFKSLSWEQWLAMSASIGFLTFLVTKEVIDIDKLVEVISALSGLF